MEMTIELLRARFLTTQLAGDRREAVRLTVDEGLRRSAPFDVLQDQVIGAAQRELGDMWERHEISIAQEHLATAIAQLSLAALFEHAPAGPRVHRSLLIACVEGELHDVPARLVADVLELAGFDVRYLGASVPHAELVEAVHRERPDAIGLSVTTSSNLSALRTAVARLREAHAAPVFVGGLALDLSSTDVEAYGVPACRGSPAALIATARRVTGLDVSAA